MLKKAIIAGASGLIGNELITLLLAEPGYNKVSVLVRKELPVKHGKLVQIVVDFDHLDEYSDKINGDVLFCCLGSTKKKTPDLTDYRKVDHDYPLLLAKICLNNNIGQFHLVSSIGADATSTNFYTKMKGETENDIIKVGLSDLYIYRPSMLTGHRIENRPLEKALTVLMKFIDPLLVGQFKKYKSIAGKTVANAMYKQSLKKEVGTFIYSSDKIKELS
jgi:uncharacterized protein YbjT (DUF2867 family)